MDWKAEIEEGRRHLKRIVALLFSLALIADRAAVLPLPKLRHLLSILRPCAIFIWQRLGDLEDIGDDAPTVRYAWDLPGFLEVCDNDRPDDARRLAGAFRLLATALAWWLVQTESAGRQAKCEGHSTVRLQPSNAVAGLCPVAHRRDWLGPD